jgi:hypothetical protein
MLVLIQGAHESHEVLGFAMGYAVLGAYRDDLALSPVSAV